MPNFLVTAAGAASVQAVPATTQSAATAPRIVAATISETAGAVGRVNIRLGTSGSDPIIAAIPLAANQSVPLYFGDAGLEVRGGIYIERTSGTFQASLYMIYP